MVFMFSVLCKSSISIANRRVTEVANYYFESCNLSEDMLLFSFTSLNVSNLFMSTQFLKIELSQRGESPEPRS